MKTEQKLSRNMFAASKHKLFGGKNLINWKQFPSWWGDHPWRIHGASRYLDRIINNVWKVVDGSCVIVGNKLTSGRISSRDNRAHTEMALVSLNGSHRAYDWCHHAIGQHEFTQWALDFNFLIISWSKISTTYFVNHYTIHSLEMIQFLYSSIINYHMIKNNWLNLRNQAWIK